MSNCNWGAIAPPVPPFLLPLAVNRDDVESVIIVIRVVPINRGSNKEVPTSRINRQATFMAVFDAPAKERT